MIKLTLLAVLGFSAPAFAGNNSGFFVDPDSGIILTPEEIAAIMHQPPPPPPEPRR